MTEVEKLNKTLEQIGATKISIFPGTDPNVTSEQVAKEIRESIERVLAGEAEFIDLGTDKERE